MGIGAYRSVLAVPQVRRIVALVFVVRVPLWAGNVALTLHVVTHLHGSYTAAGFTEAVATVAIAVSSPWRGRRIDRLGLRRTVAPSLVVLTACWSIAPFVGYWPLLAFVSVAGLFAVPSFTIVRQALLRAVPDDQRRTALSIDSVLTELTFMVGPPLGVLLATAWPTPWALFGCEMASVLGSSALWLINPPVRADVAEDAAGTRPPIRQWATGPVVSILAMSATAVLVLTGSGVSIVAALRAMHHGSWIGWEMGLWGAGSAVGGVLYGAIRRTVPVPLLLIGLAGTAIPVALAREPVSLAFLLVLSGVFCAPTITATVDALTRATPPAVRGEVLGWHGAAMTAGGAAGTPLSGIAIDHVGWGGGFVLPGLIGVVAAVAGLLVDRRRPDRVDPAPLDRAPVAAEL